MQSPAAQPQPFIHTAAGANPTTSALIKLAVGQLGLAPALPTALPYTFASSLRPALTALTAHHLTQSKPISAHRPFFNCPVLPVLGSLPFEKLRISAARFVRTHTVRSQFWNPI